MNSNTKKLETFLSKLGFDPESDFKKTDIPFKIDIDFVYKTKIDIDFVSKTGELSSIYFKYLPESTLSTQSTELFELHQKIWNENKTEVFVVVSDNKTLLCASKYKPDIENSLNCKLEDFSYGINSPGFETKKLEPLLKDNIDYGFFWDFVRKKIEDRKRKSVDYDLLLNLVKLKESLERELSQGKSYILIERCLFLNFLENRAFLLPKTFLDILKSKDSQRLLTKFNEVNNSLNGNVFDETIFAQKEISKSIIDELHNFFTTDYRNKYKQIRLFPYKFDIIPVELLSNIYEAFLKTTDQKKNGVYYTPSNLVDLVLSETLEPVLQNNPKPACLDFACGSGIFLVKSLEKIIDKNNCRKDFEKKKNLLKNCIFGVEKDPVATRITIFSLYLTLLDGEDSENIKQLIKSNKIKFPKLFDKNILCKDTLFDDLNFINDDDRKFEVFDVIAGNPPWGVDPFKDNRDRKMKLPMEMQKAVKRRQSSQYFVFKAKEFMSDESIAGLIINNSSFLTTIAESFRKQVLKDFDITAIYELSQTNPIFFKKEEIEDLKIGADEPAAVLVFRKKKQEIDNIIRYINPSLEPLSDFLKILIIKRSEIMYIKQNQLYEDDRIWRILVTGDMEDHRIVKKLEGQKEITLKAGEGFSATRFEKYRTILKDAEYINASSIASFVFFEDKKQITPKEGIKIEVVRRGFDNSKKLLIKRRITSNLRVKAGYDNTGYRFKNDLLALFFDNYDYRLMLSICNSSLISYFIMLCSAQIGKGTRGWLQTSDIKGIPVPAERNIPDKYKKNLIDLTERIIKSGYADFLSIGQIDEIVFDIYHLKEFEKQRIRDFFNVRYRDKGREAYVAKDDLQKYVNRFRNVFRFILKDDKYLNAKGYISSSIGTGIIFVLSDKKEKQEGIEFLNVADIKKFTQVVSKKQLDDSQRNKMLKQEKIKIYDKNQFVIIKSNQFKDWTETEAIKDANEEIGEWLKHLPKG